LSSDVVSVDENCDYVGGCWCWFYWVVFLGVVFVVKVCDFVVEFVGDFVLYVGWYLEVSFCVFDGGGWVVYDFCGGFLGEVGCEVNCLKVCVCLNEYEWFVYVVLYELIVFYCECLFFYGLFWVFMC